MPRKPVQEKKNKKKNAGLAPPVAERTTAQITGAARRGRRPHRARDNSRQRRVRRAEKAGVNGCRFRVRAQHRDDGGGSSNMDEKLILAVFHYPELYNASVPKYRCAVSRASAWKNISSVVGLPCEWRSGETHNLCRRQ